MRGQQLTGGQSAGPRVYEVRAVGRLGVSRTPVRAALLRLEEEGFLEALPGGGYAVKTFSEQDAFDAIEIRGALEGLACGLAAERGVDAGHLTRMDELVAEIDAVITRAKM